MTEVLDLVVVVFSPVETLAESLSTAPVALAPGPASLGLITDVLALVVEVFSVGTLAESLASLLLSKELLVVWVDVFSSTLSGSRSPSLVTALVGGGGVEALAALTLAMEELVAVSGTFSPDCSLTLTSLDLSFVPWVGFVIIVPEPASCELTELGGAIDAFCCLDSAEPCFESEAFGDVCPTVLALNSFGTTAAALGANVGLAFESVVSLDNLLFATASFDLPSIERASLVALEEAIRLSLEACGAAGARLGVDCEVLLAGGSATLDIVWPPATVLLLVEDTPFVALVVEEVAVVPLGIEFGGVTVELATCLGVDLV